MAQRELVIVPRTFPGLEQLSPAELQLMGCRSFGQYCCMLRSVVDPEQFCPFCAAELARRKRKILWQQGEWLLLENEFPRKGVAKMLLIVPKRHLTSVLQMQPVDAANFLVLLQMSGVENGGVLLRIGHPRWNASTVEHLHWNVIEPIPGIELRPPLARNLSEYMADHGRLLEFQTVLEDMGGERWLFSDEGIAETQPKAA
jgi:diadenosine tetraphosphate (Ap4A) HIT family hydrolase